MKNMKEEIRTILVTDFSIDRDVDDWFDTLIFATLPELHPVGIVLEHYATDEVEAKIKQLLNAAGVKGLAIVRGIQKNLTWKNNALIASQYHNGSQLIIDKMENTEAKVRIVCVGSLRNEALAYKKEPKLFMEKIEAIYFTGGTLDGSRDLNVKRA